MKRRLIGLTGPARSGKTTVADILHEHHGLDIVPLALPIKQGVYNMFCFSAQTRDHLLDDDRKEVPLPVVGKSPRELYQSLGTEWGRDMIDPRIWIRLAQVEIERLAQMGGAWGVVVPDVRFVNEAEWIRREGGQVWRIVRPGSEGGVRAHESEAGLPPDLIDAGIVNDGDLAQLAERVRELMG